MIDFLERCILIISISTFAAGINLVKAQNRLFPVDSLTTVIDGDYPPFNQILPGDTLLLKFGHRDFILFCNLKGKADKPVVIINDGGIVKINTDHYYGISIRNCQHFKVTGTGDAKHFYGFMIERVKNGGGIGIGEKSSDFEIDHISIENCLAVGISAKTDPDCSFTSTREKFTQFNTIIHDNYIANVGNEGLYIGSTKYHGQEVNCDGRDTLLFPSLLDGVKIYNNIIQSTGWDGIQASSASKNCQIFNNIVKYDSQDEYYNQMSGIMLGGGSKCDCFNNFIFDGNGNGIENHGLGGNRIFNNIIVDAGRNFLPLDSSQMRHGIFVSDVSVQTDSSFYILNNDIINPKSDGIRFSSIKSKNNLIASNVIINPGNFDFYENGKTRFSGNDAYIMFQNTNSDVILRNNYLARNTTLVGFSSQILQSPTDFKLMLGSPLIDAADIVSWLTFDFSGLSRPNGLLSDIGAYEYNSDSSNGFQPFLHATLTQLMENPVNDFLNIRSKIELEQEITIDIYNSGGQLITHFQKSDLRNDNKIIQANVANIPSGFYFYVIHIGIVSESAKFLKN